MRTMKLRKLIVLMITCILLCSTPVTIQAASGINANEEELLSVARGTFQVNGKLYQVQSSYINQAYNYFNRDGIHITEKQKEAILDRGMRMLSKGVENGYLVEVPEVPEVTLGPPETTENPPQAGESTPPTQSQPPKESSEPMNSIAPSVSALPTQKPIMKAPVPEKEQSTIDLIQDAIDVADDLGLGVSVDFTKKEVSVTEDNGKVVFDSTKVIKETGFSMFTPMVVLLLLLLTLISTIVTCIRYRLLAHDDER